jgi:hypothetical protein
VYVAERGRAWLYSVSANELSDKSAPTFPCLNGPGRLLNLRKLPYSSPIAQRAA